jgi:hypothetical protein
MKFRKIDFILFFFKKITCEDERDEEINMSDYLYWKRNCLQLSDKRLLVELDFCFEASTDNTSWSLLEIMYYELLMYISRPWSHSWFVKFVVALQLVD